MNTLPRLLLSVLWSVASGAAAHAELKWDTTELVMHVKAWSPSETVKFGFVNAGAAPVKVTQVAAGCGCTQARATVDTVAPGERAEITAEFHPAGKNGLVRIPIRVFTDGNTEPERTLVLAAAIEEGVLWQSRFVYWKDGEPRDARKLRFTVPEPKDVALGELQTTQPGFVATLAAAADGEANAYEITVTPPATGGPAFSAVMLHTKEGPNRAERVYTLLARTF